MQFTKKLREPVMRGEINCSVRIWQRPHVKVGGRYPLGDGFVHVTSIRKIGFEDITPALARRSGFLGRWISSSWRTRRRGKDIPRGVRVSAYSATGRVKLKVAPCPSIPAAEIRPLWVSMIVRQMERPMPMPSGLVL